VNRRTVRLEPELELLSWGFPKTPLHREPDRASTPGWLPTLRLEDANLELVPSLPFLPASTASSARPPQVCCTLHPIMGFGPFRVNDAEHALRRFQPRLPSPEPRFTPFRAFSSPSAVPRHRGPCPRAVRRHRAPKCEAPFRPRGLAPPTSPVSRPDVTAATDPLLSWASFPSRVLPEFSMSRVPKDWRPDLP